MNKLTTLRFWCSSQNERHAVGDLSPHQLLRTVTHGDGVSLEHPDKPALALALRGAPSDARAQATGLAQVLEGSVPATPVLFSRSHVPVDRDHLLRLPAASQPLQGLLTLAQGLIWPLLALIDPVKDERTNR